MHLVFRVQAADISIHALREEGDFSEKVKEFFGFQFLSTPSARRATRGPAVLCSRRHISIHALREEGDEINVHVDSYGGISIHALREEGDSSPGTLQRHFDNFYPRPPRGGRRNRLLHYQEMLEFLSTPSARRATQRLPGGQQRLPISIHALREEGDRITG